MCNTMPSNVTIFRSHDSVPTYVMLHDAALIAYVKFVGKCASTCIHHKYFSAHIFTSLGCKLNKPKLKHTYDPMVTFKYLNFFLSGTVLVYFMRCTC